MKIVALLSIAIITCALALAQPPAPGGRAGRAGRGARPRGPAGPLPRLSDGHPDLSGIWNGFGGSGATAHLQPWAEKIVAERRAKGGAEDFEARCLPGGPPRAAPYHTSLFSTPKLVLMLFEGNTHMYRQFFVDGSDHPKNLKPTSMAIRVRTGTATRWWSIRSGSTRFPGTISRARRTRTRCI